MVHDQALLDILLAKPLPTQNSAMCSRIVISLFRTAKEAQR
jgi:hypothetical protein